MMYREPEIEITRFDDNEVATDIPVASGHRPGDGDIGYDEFI